MIDFLRGLGQRKFLIAQVLICHMSIVEWLCLVSDLQALHLICFIVSGFLSLGYSTPFLSLGSSYMYPSLAAAKAAVISVGEEIATQGLPLGICPLVFVFTGSGNGMELGNDTLFLYVLSFLK